MFLTNSHTIFLNNFSSKLTNYQASTSKLPTLHYLKRKAGLSNHVNMLRSVLCVCLKAEVAQGQLRALKCNLFPNVTLMKCTCNSR